MRRYLLPGLVLAVVAAVAVWQVFVAAPRRSAETQPSGQAVPDTPSVPVETERVKVTLYYVSPGGLRLVAVERDVSLGGDTVSRARQIAEAQIGEAPRSYAAPFPAGTTLRALFVTERGEAFVDLSQEASAGHPGGSIAEILTVYALVNALTVNLPAISAVQILVDGQEVDTLAGHVDLRHPLPQSLRWVRNPDAPEQP
jgi:hypothetical protein